MAYLEINPRYRPMFAGLHITTAEALLAVPAVAVSGHPERNVSRIRLGSIDAFLKCEHRVRLRDRLVNAMSGFGPVSKAAREVQLLRFLPEHGIGCPEWIACGQDSSGRALLVVRKLAGFQDLRRFLHDHRELPGGLRRRLAETLGTALARVHDAGIDHADLLGKHVLIDPQTEQISVLDWQRARWHAFVPWSLRCADLAALDATLADDLCSPRDRLYCVLAYLRAHARSGCMPPARPPSSRTILREIRAQSLVLQRKRRICEQRLPPSPPGSQEIVRVEGEALCVARSFWDELQRWSPAELFRLRQRIPARDKLSREVVDLPGGRRALLVQRRSPALLKALWCAVRRRRQESPELRLACRLNRAARPTSETPRLLAYGQRRSGFWHVESFLLTELPQPAEEVRRVA
jgi:hypothetical protein